MKTILVFKVLIVKYRINSVKRVNLSVNGGKPSLLNIRPPSPAYAGLILSLS
jgi:hypothetical protein